VAFTVGVGFLLAANTHPQIGQFRQSVLPSAFCALVLYWVTVFALRKLLNALTAARGVSHSAEATPAITVLFVAVAGDGISVDVAIIELRSLRDV
jgi:hypothetical protein